MSCYSCENCLNRHGEDTECEDVKLTGPFTAISLEHESRSSETELRVQTAPSDEDQQTTNDLVTPGMLIAVVADDAENEYFILEAKFTSYTTKKDVQDVWGARFPCGMEVIRGLYYDKMSDDLLSYRKIKRKPAIIPATSLSYIMSDITADDNITISEDIGILACLQDVVILN